MLRHVGFGKTDVKIYGAVFKEQFSFRSLPSYLAHIVRRGAWRALRLEIRGGIAAIATKGGGLA